MGTEELTKFLVDNLRVEVWCNRKIRGYPDGAYDEVVVKLFLGDREISRDTDTLY